MANSSSEIRIRKGELNSDLCNHFRDSLLNELTTLSHNQKGSQYGLPPHLTADDATDSVAKPVTNYESIDESSSETPRKMILPYDSIFLYAETGPEGNPTPIGSLSLIQIHSHEAHFKGLPSELEAVGEMKRMIVFPEYRSHGVGSKLIEEMERIAKDELGLKYLVVETIEPLVEAQKFYSRAGFERRSVWGLYGGESLCYGKWL